MMMGACVNFMIMLSLFIVILVLVGETPDTNLLYLFPLMGILLSLAMGIGMCLAILNVYFRDMAQLTPIILQFWFWLTPIVYPISILPISIQELVLVLNPLAAVVSAMHSILVFHRPVEMESLLVPLAFAFVACLIALKLHKSHCKYLVDEL
jgi:lipopolysaccharide transport system permease protein